VIGANHHRDSEEWRSRIAGRAQHEADRAAKNAGEGAHLQEHVLVENAAP
jgi:hypothetical protein